MPAIKYEQNKEKEGQTGKKFLQKGWLLGLGVTDFF